MVVYLTVVRSLIVVTVVVPLLPFLTVGLNSHDSYTPSDHGLTQANATEAASPAMLAFFHVTGEGSAAELPVAAGSGNRTDPLWDVAGKQVPVEAEDDSGGKGVRGKVRTALMVVGIVSGVGGIGLVAAFVVVYVLQRRRSSSLSEEKLEGERALHQLEPV